MIKAVHIRNNGRVSDCTSYRVLSAVPRTSWALCCYSMTRVLSWIVHLCRGLRLGNNPVKCSQVVQVLLCSFAMNHPTVAGTSTVLIQVHWRALRNGSWWDRHWSSITRKKNLNLRRRRGRKVDVCTDKVRWERTHFHLNTLASARKTTTSEI